MKHRSDRPQGVAAAKAGISERSARRIDMKELQPQLGQRTWRTRPDPLIDVWASIVVPWLERNETISSIGIFDYLCEYHGDCFDPRARRTLERRIRAWRQLHGPEQDVVFLQTHAPGDLGIADFTVVNEPVTICAQPLKHRLFHYRLVASGWAYVQVVCGGESFSALSDGLQNAFWQSGGVPRQLRTDSLSAAYKNKAEHDDFTCQFGQLCQHYGVRATRNNRGVAHENGAIESPNNHLKRQLHQALVLRGSFEFDTLEAYNKFVQQLVARRNRRVATAWADERRQLRPLPSKRSVNYSEQRIRVTRSSTIEIRRIVYTVPSRLIGARVTVRIYDTKLEIWCANECTLTLDRVFAPAGKTRARSVDYRHVIEALVKKPRAFRSSQLRDELLPTHDYQTIWQHVDHRLSADAACQYIVRLLHLAKKTDHQDAIGRYVLDQVALRGLPSLLSCEERFAPKTRVMPKITVRQHNLHDYNRLLQTTGVQHG